MFTLQIKNSMLIALAFVVSPFVASAHIIGEPAHDGTMVFAAKSSKTNITPNF